MIKLHISRGYLQNSLSILQSSPKKEKVILWFGRETDGIYFVEEVFVPFQISDRDYFTIPPEGMSIVMQKIKATRSMLVAQVHTHPFHAFHSIADDKWAILRHLNAYSIVLPRFCSTTDISNFKSNAATFILNNVNSWEKISNANLVIL